MHFPFFILPFDHRNGLAKIIDADYPFSAADLKRVNDLKHVIFEAILEVKNNYSGPGTLGALFDEETALDVILEAKKIGLPITVSLEKSGSKTFELIHGDQFADRLKDLRPTYAKALVHYQAGHDEAGSQRQLLKRVSDACETIGVPMMLEILLDKPEGHTPEDMLAVFKELHEAGVKVAIWKIEGFNSAEDWKQLAPEAKAPMIILGRGQDRAAVEAWVKAAANSGVVNGFAIGRTIFQAEIIEYVGGRMKRDETVKAVAANYHSFINLWQEYV